MPSRHICDHTDMCLVVGSLMVEHGPACWWFRDLPTVLFETTNAPSKHVRDHIYAPNRHVSVHKFV